MSDQPHQPSPSKSDATQQQQQQAEQQQQQQQAAPERPKPKIEPGKDLWHNIGINVKDASAAAADQTDQTVLVVGSRAAGKTSLISRILGSSASSAKATTALEYYYGKREERNTTQIAHFWELAQGIELANLADVVVTAENVHTVVAVVVVDCGDLHTAWETATFWLKYIDKRVQAIFGKMRAKDSKTPDKMLNRQKRAINGDLDGSDEQHEAHPDLESLRLSGVPTVLVLGRQDTMKQDTVKAKTLVRSMRFLAHLYGATLVFSSQHERDIQLSKEVLGHTIYGLPFERPMQTDSEKGTVVVLRGRDSFRDIGDPAPTMAQGFQPTGDNALDRWKAPFDEIWPPKPAAHNSGQKEAQAEDAFVAELYNVEGGHGEPAIDATRKQKDSELEEYRKNSNKKEKKGE